MLIITISTFVCIVFAVMAVYWTMSRPVSATADRLRDLDEPRSMSSAQTLEHDTVATLAERIAEPINRLVPPSAADADKLHKKLMQAGYRSASAPSVYRATQLILMLGFPLAIFLGWTAMARPAADSLIPVLGAFVAGFILPRYLLGKFVASRQLRITWGLADALDLMVITMEAGLGLNSAMQRVGEDLNSLVAMMIQADRFGTSIARAVRVYSDSLRTKRRQRAEQAAQKAAFKLLLPLGALLF